MKDKLYKYDMEELYQLTVKRLEDFGIELIEIARLVQKLQGDYIEEKDALRVWKVLLGRGSLSTQS